MTKLWKIASLLSFAILLILALTACKKHTHEWGEWQVYKLPTCLVDGTNIRECSGCDLTEYTTVAATGHTFSEWYTTVPNGCVSIGFIEHACECGFTEESVVPSLGGHLFDVGVVTKEPTCTEDGVKESKCIMCPATVTESIEGGHRYVDGVCTLCSDAIVDIIAPELPLTVNHISANDDAIYETCEILDVYIKIEHSREIYNVLIYFDCKLIYSLGGESARTEFGCELLDSDGNIVSRTEVITEMLPVDGVAYSSEIKLCGLNLDEDEIYTVRFTDLEGF